MGRNPLFYLFIENVIRENQWGGVDIRRGGVPVLRSNLICFGYSDGVVVGDEGKGLIEGNTIYGEVHVPAGRGLGSSPAREAGSPGSICSWWILRKSLPVPGPQRHPEEQHQSQATATWASQNTKASPKSPCNAQDQQSRELHPHLK